jgi:hypothetical protein
MADERGNGGPYPVRSAIVDGVPADLILDIVSGTNTPVEIKDLSTDQKKIPTDPSALHHCPLCEEFFTWVIFKAHVRQCVLARTDIAKRHFPVAKRDAIIEAKPADASGR